MKRSFLVFVLVSLSACSDGGGDALDPSSDAAVSPDTAVAAVLSLVTAAPATAPAGDIVPDLAVRLTEDGAPLAEIPLAFSVTKGGGSVSAELQTDAAGEAVLPWQLGIAPVDNTLHIAAAGTSLEVTIRATRETTTAPEALLDLDAFLTGEGLAGTTEDLAFTADGAMLMGVPGALVRIDAAGEASLRALSGDPLTGPLGVAVDGEGGVWIADSDGSALRHVSPDGTVTTPLVDDGAEPLQAPNYVAVGPAGRIYVTDPCLGALLRYDPSEGVVDAVERFDVATEGGPNGLAFDEDGGELYVTTENTGLLCGHSVDAVANLAGLYALPVDEGGFGERRSIATGIGLFADGLAFDIEGNLYVAIDRVAGLSLDESAIEVLPAGSDTLLPFLSVSDRILANVAFGVGGFGETTLYVALLSVPPFTEESARGVERIEVGIAGLPLYGVGR